MYLYLGSGVAIRSRWTDDHNDISIMHTSFSYVGETQEIAEAWALSRLQALWTVDDGYHHHRVRMNRISDRDLADILRSLEREGA